MAKHEVFFSAQVWRSVMLFLTKGTLRLCHNKYEISLWHVALHEVGLIKIWLHFKSASDSNEDMSDESYSYKVPVIRFYLCLAVLLLTHKNIV